MIEFVVCSAAEAEYAEALSWYAERSVSAAERFDAEFDQVLQTVASDPERFPRCERLHRPMQPSMGRCARVKSTAVINRKSLALGGHINRRKKRDAPAREISERFLVVSLAGASG